MLKVNTQRFSVIIVLERYSKEFKFERRYTFFLDIKGIKSDFAANMHSEEFKFDLVLLQAV